MAADLVQPPSASVPIKTEMPALMADQVTRRSGNYHPSVWGYHFLSYVSEIDPSMEDRREKLKEEVRAMIVASASNNSGHELDLIDQVQRLGVSYHFEKEIDLALQHVYDTRDYNREDDELYTVALRFRLLRQQGYKITCDVFNNFKETNGKFKKTLTNDIRGMMSLYEAAYMRVHGEDILDEALEFTTNHLKSMNIVQLSKPLAEQVSHALARPLRKGLERLEARRYISAYQQETSRNELLSEFASLDFNILQKVHQKELSDITRWWKDLNFMEKLPFARDRMVECYFWSMGVYFEPQYSFARSVQTKVIALTSVLDDIYDLYGTLEELVVFTDAVERFGTLEELVVFTDAVERWDISVIDQLPEYLKVLYRALFDVFTEMGLVLANEGKSYRIPYAKTAMKKQVRSYFKEAKWYHEGYIPTMDEYMEVALMSSGYIMLSTITLIGMGDEYVNKEAFEWVSNEPLIVKASAVIARIMNDMVGPEREKERGEVASAVECYMKQHGASKESTYTVFEELVKNAWKDINQECLGTNVLVPMPLMKRFLNLARVIDVLYKDKDAYTDSSKHTRDLITLLLVDPVPEL